MNKTLDKQTLTWYYVVSKERDATVSKDWRFTLYDRTVLKVRSSSEWIRRYLFATFFYL